MLRRGLEWLWNLKFELLVLTAALVVLLLFLTGVDPSLPVAILATIGVLLALFQDESKQRNPTRTRRLVVSILSLVCIWIGYLLRAQIDCASPIEVVIHDGRVEIGRTGCYAVDTGERSTRGIVSHIDCLSGTRFDLIQAHAEQLVVFQADPKHLVMPAEFTLDAPGDILQMECRPGGLSAEINRSSGN